MRRLLWNKRGQSIFEYAMLVAVVVLALFAMSIYGKRALQGRMSDASDDIGEQFDPLNTTMNWTTSRTSKSVEITNGSTGNITTYLDPTRHTDSKSDWTQRTGYENVTAW